MGNEAAHARLIGPTTLHDVLQAQQQLELRFASLERALYGGPPVKDFVIAFVADHGAINSVTQRAAQAIAKRKVNLLVHGGDNNYGASTSEAYRTVLAQFLTAAPAHAMILGNHDRSVSDPSGHILRSTFPQYMHADLLNPAIRPSIGLPYYAVDLQKYAALDCKLIFCDSCAQTGDVNLGPAMSYGNDRFGGQGAELRTEAINANRSIAFMHHPWATAMSSVPSPSDRWSEGLRWFGQTSVRLACFGHTHVAGAYGIDRDGIMLAEASAMAFSPSALSSSVQYYGDDKAYRVFTSSSPTIVLITISVDAIVVDVLAVPSSGPEEGVISYSMRVDGNATYRSSSDVDIRNDLCEIKASLANLTGSHCSPIGPEIAALSARIQTLERCACGSNSPTY